MSSVPMARLPKHIQLIVCNDEYPVICLLRVLYWPLLNEDLEKYYSNRGPVPWVSGDENWLEGATRLRHDDFISSMNWVTAASLVRPSLGFPVSRKQVCQGWSLPSHPEDAPDLPRGKYPSIYLVQAGEGGPVKIGVSTDVPSRIRSLQTGIPQPLILLATFPGCRSKERRLHERLARYRIRGEWFSPAPEVLAAAEEVT